MIDFVIAAVLMLFAVLGWKRGLVRTLTELLTVVLALALSAQIAKTAAPVIVDKALRPATHTAIERRVDEIMTEAGPDISPVKELGRVMEAIPNDFIREQARHFLKGLDTVAEEAMVPTQDHLTRAAKDIADAVLDGAVRDLIQSILCAACFMILTILFRLAARILRLAEKLPGLRQLNELGGALLGLGKGLILVCLVLWVLRHTGMITPEMAESSLLMGAASRWSGGLLW